MIENSRRMEFRRRAFSGIPQVEEIRALPPSARRGLLEEGIPEYFFYRDYSADPDLAVVQRLERVPLVRFGSDGAGIMGVDARSGRVIRVYGSRYEKEWPVNETVLKFTETVRVLTERFPYYGDDAGYEDIDAAAHKLRVIIKSIDSEAMAPGSYWAELVDEIDCLIFDPADVYSWYLRKQSSP